MIYTISFSREVKPDFISKMIMKFLKTNYSHVFIRDGEYIYHATGKGVNKQSVTSFLESGKMIVKESSVDLDISQHELDLYMRGACGKEYSSSQFIGFMFPWAQRFVRNGSEKMICSELVATVLNDYGVDETIAYFKDPDFVSPKDIYKEIIK